MGPLEVFLHHPGPWLCWILPIIGALLMPLLGKVNHKLRDYAAVAFAFSAVVSAASMIPYLISGHYPGDIKLTTWIAFPGGAHPLEVGVLVDPLSIIIANVVAFISFLIVVYSLGYMHGDPHLTRYWFFFLFFVGSMLLLVMGDNFIQLLIGWEGVGMCSYGLIGFYYRDPEERWLGGPPPTKMFPPSECGMKAFVVTGVGDVLILAAIFIIYHYAGTLNFVDLTHHSEEWLRHMTAIPGLVSVTAVLLLGGPIGKSAQFPLHEWLPEAMAGPTSVSALIHAATMVKAGVYLVARVSPIFHAGYWAYGIGEAMTFFIAIAFVGAFTCFLAASQAVVSLELKKILAYSTVSQIGYMMLGLGVSGLSEGNLIMGMTAGVFHLVSHALFKAALFLCAGSVLHAVESIYIFNMGGLKKWMPITHGFMLLATLSLSGIPPFSGFFSKDAVFVACLNAALHHSPYALYALALLAIGAISAGMTFFYSLRMVSLTFYGHPSHYIEEMEHHGHHVHEMKPIMWVPYGILVVVMIAVGLLGAVGLVAPSVSPELFIEHRLHHMVEHLYEHMHIPLHVAHVETSTKLIGVGLSAVMLLIGGFGGYVFYLARKIDPMSLVKKSPVLSAAHKFLWNRWYMNPTFYRVFVYGLLDFKEAVFRTLEKGLFDKISDAVVGLTLAIKDALNSFPEAGFFDKISDGVVGLTLAIRDALYVVPETAFFDRISGGVSDFIVWLGGALFGSLETEGIDRGLNVGIPEAATGLYHRLKRIQTGVLSYNMLYIVFTLVVLILIFMVWGV